MDTGQARDLETTSGKRGSPDRATLLRVAAVLRCQLDGEAIPATPPFTGRLWNWSVGRPRRWRRYTPRGACEKARTGGVRRANPDLPDLAAKWRVGHPHGTLRQAVTLARHRPRSRQ